jgi:hypothetical protein
MYVQACLELSIRFRIRPFLLQPLSVICSSITLGRAGAYILFRSENETFLRDPHWVYVGSSSHMKNRLHSHGRITVESFDRMLFFPTHEWERLERLLILTIPCRNVVANGKPADQVKRKRWTMLNRFLAPGSHVSEEELIQQMPRLFSTASPD